LLFVPSFAAAWAQYEGTLGSNLLGQAFVAIFYILRFPTHTLFWSFIANGGVFMLFSGIFINCMFYGVITERIFSIFKLWKK
jgi:hypothetical protein